MNRFEQQLVKTIPLLRRYARALCNDSHQADDLVQECLARAISRRRLWVSNKGMRPWLFTILHNIFVNTLRHTREMQVFHDDDEFSSTLVGGEEADTLSTLSEFEKALNRLSPEQREVLLLVGLEQLSYREVSRIVGIPAGTVMSRLSRAREQLRLNMKGEVTIAKIKRVK